MQSGQGPQGYLDQIIAQAERLVHYILWWTESGCCEEKSQQFQWVGAFFIELGLKIWYNR